MVRKILHNVLWCGATAALFILFILILPSAIPAATPPTSTYLSAISNGLSGPARLAVGPDGRIYVADPDKDRVQVYSPAGNLKYTVENFQGTPLSIAVDGAGNIYIGDARTNSVMVFDSSWTYLRKLGNGNGEFGMPGDITVSNSTGRIYVTDSKGDMVKVYNSDGSFYASFGGHGGGAGQFNFPTGIVADDTNSEIFASDSMFNGSEWIERIQIFDLAGNYKAVITLGTSYNIKAQGIAIDSLGRVYAVNSLQGRVDVYDRSGQYLASIGSLGTQAGQLRIPSDAVIDSNNRLLITSSDSGRVVLYGIDNYTIPVDPPDIYTLTVAKSGTGSGTVISGSAEINCGGVCSASYVSGTAVTLTATPANSGSVFGSWNGCDTVTGATCNVNMSSNKMVTANFMAETTPPVLTVNQANPSILWPANGAMINVAVSGNAVDAGSGLKAVSYTVADEYNKLNSTGTAVADNTGNFSFTVSLEAARNKNDINGRIYTITVTAVDINGNAGQKSVLVTVPYKK